MNRRTTVVVAGSVAVVAAAATIWTLAATKDDGHPLPGPAAGTAVSYRLAIPKSGTGDGGQFPVDGAGVALTPDGGAVLAVGSSPARAFRLSPSGNLSEVSSDGISSLGPVTTASGTVLLAVTSSGVVAYDPKAESRTTIADASNLAGAWAIGETADGSVLAVDGAKETVWSLKDGTAKQLLQFPASGLNPRCSDAAGGQGCADDYLAHAVVDGQGVIYALEHYTGSVRDPLQADDYAPLNTVLTATASGGTPARVTLPASVAGVPGDPGALRTLAITAADDGVYALVETPGGDFTAARYVLHLHGGAADLVAAQAALANGGGSAKCSFQGSLSPTALPCLPDHDTSLAYGAGRLLVSGWLDAPNGSPASQTANVVIGVRG